MGSPYQLVFCTCPDQETAQRIGHTLIDTAVAACVNIIPGLTSIYRFEGQIETNPECLLLIKTTSENYAQLEIQLSKLHPYRVPEIIACNISHGLPAYLQWLDESTKST